MKTPECIAFTINRFPKVYVFTYADFVKLVKKKEDIIKALKKSAK